LGAANRHLRGDLSHNEKAVKFFVSSRGFSAHVAQLSKAPSSVENSASRTRLVLPALLLVALAAVFLLWRDQATDAFPTPAGEVAVKQPIIVGEPLVEVLEIADAPPDMSDVVTIAAPGPTDGFRTTGTLLPADRLEPTGIEGIPNLAILYSELAAAARAGDLEAAWKLGGGLSVCGSHFRQLSKLEKRIHPHRVLADEVSRDREFAEVSAAMERPTFKTRDANCKGVTKEQVTEAEDWLLLAANQGDQTAAHYYVNNMQGRLGELALDPPALMRFRTNASRLMHRDASQCVGTAFNWLSIAYQIGTFETRDQVRAVAYGAVFAWAAGDLQPQISRLNFGQPPLSPLQARQAQDLARRLYQAYCRI